MPAIEILFKIDGQAQLQAAINGINASLDKMSKATQKAGTSSADARIASEKKVAAEVAKSAKAQEKALLDSIKGAEKAFDAAEKSKTKVARAEAAARAKDMEKYLSTTRAVNDYNAKEFERLEREKTRIAQAEARKRSETINKIAGGAGKLIGGATARTAGVVGRAATGLMLGGGFLIADSMHQGIKEEAMAGVVFRSSAEHGNVKSSAEVGQMASAAAIASGQKKEDILSGLTKFVGITGDLGQAKELLTDMAKLSSATGTNFEEMAAFGGEVQSKLQDSAKTMDVMRAIAQQGRSGAIDIKDLAQYGTRLASGALSYSGDISSNIKSLGAIAQITRRYGTAEDAAVATMAIERISSDAQKKSGKVKQEFGVDFYTDSSKTQLRPPEEIVMDAVSATRGNEEKLHKIFDARSFRGLSGLQYAYQEGAGQDAFGRSNLASTDKSVVAAADARGVAAMKDQIAKAKGGSFTQADVERENANKLLETQSQINIAMEKFHEEINGKLLPMMPQLIKMFTDLIPAIKSVIDFFAGGSLTSGLAKVIAAIFVAELAKGAISAGATSGATALFKMIGEKFGVKLPGAAGSGGGAGAGGLVLGAAVVGYGIGDFIANKIIDPNSTGFEKGAKQAAGIRDNAVSATTGVLSGKLSPEEAEKWLFEQRKIQQNAKLNTEGNIFTDLFGPGPSVGQAQEQRAQNEALSTATFTTEALDKLQSAIELRKAAEKSGQAGTALIDAAGRLTDSAAAIKAALPGGPGDKEAGGGAAPQEVPTGAWPGGGFGY